MSEFSKKLYRERRSKGLRGQGPRPLPGEPAEVRRDPNGSYHSAKRYNDASRLHSKSLLKKGSFQRYLSLTIYARPAHSDNREGSRETNHQRVLRQRGRA